MKKRNHILFIFLIVYVVLQSIWWLYNIYDLSAQVKADNELRGKLYMILGEGAVFFVIVSIGFFITYRSLNKEIQVNHQQKNFLLSITHELKTPIASLKLYLQTLIKRDLSEEKRTGILHKSIKDADRLNNLVENILLATKIDDNKFPLHFEQFNLSDLIESKSIEMLESSGKMLNFEFFIDPNISFNGDKDAFESILSNLLSNAIKYAPENSSVCVTLVEREGEIALSVSDEGPGIPLKEHRSVFKKFYRTGDEETRNKKGTGLGLYIVKKLVDQHEGLIQIKPNKPKGSIFVISFKVYKN